MRVGWSERQRRSERAETPRKRTWVPGLGSALAEPRHGLHGGGRAVVLDALGEPYITTRPSRRSRRGADGGEPSGMGLGFFIAKTLLERSGGTVVLENRQPPESGAIARVMWRREVFERRRTIPQAAIERRLEASQSDQFQPN